jgi:hypothetical protein
MLNLWYILKIEPCPQNISAKHSWPKMGALVVALGLLTVANAAAPPPPRPSTCPIAHSEPWATSSGCCCCTGECLYKDCPPCPCPMPPPGKKQPPCFLGSIKEAFIANYKSVIDKTKPTEWPSKTALAGGHWSWGFSDGWTSGFFPGLLWQLANNTGDESFKDAAAQVHPRPYPRQDVSASVGL